MNAKTINKKNQIKNRLVEKYKDYQKNEIFKNARKALKNVVDKKIFFDKILVGDFSYTADDIRHIDALARLILKEDVFVLYNKLSNNAKRKLLSNATAGAVNMDAYTADKKAGEYELDIRNKLTKMMYNIALLLATDNGTKTIKL